MVGVYFSSRASRPGHPRQSERDIRYCACVIMSKSFANANANATSSSVREAIL